MEIRCAIVDDEPLAIGLLKSYVKKTPQLKLCGTYSNALEAMEGLREEPADLVFLDIQMPEINGLELARMIDTHNTRIVFTTAFGQYALDGFKVNALDYLLKPISYADFMLTIQKALQWFELLAQADGHDENHYTKDEAEAANSKRHKTDDEDSYTDNYMFVKSEYRIIRINFADILYIEGLKDYVKIYLEQAQRPVLCLTSMHAIEKMLPATGFFRIHRSYIVNMNKVSVFERSQIVFGDKYLPVSDSYRAKVQEYINAHLLQAR